MVLLPVGAAIFGAIQVRVSKNVVLIDNAVFRLHYVVTTSIFVVASILTAYNIRSQPMVCAPTQISASFANSYCSLQTHYQPYIQTSDYQIGPHPGVETGETKTVEKITYYKWVPYVLLVQGLFFLIPYWLWRSFECGKMERLTERLMDNRPTEEDRKYRQQHLVEYLFNTRRHNKCYALWFYVCEVLNLVVAVGNIIYLDKFVGGTLSDHGIRIVNVVNLKDNNRTDVMAEIFPRYTKCVITKFGPSGVLQKFDSLCTLPFNETTERLFIYLYCWLIFLVAIATAAVIYRLVVVTVPSVRVMLLSEEAGLPQHDHIHNIVKTGTFGDFFVLSMLGRNLDPVMYQSVLQDLGEKLGAAMKPIHLNPLNVGYHQQVDFPAGN